MGDGRGEGSIHYEYATKTPNYPPSTHRRIGRPNPGPCVGSGRFSTSTQARFHENRGIRSFGGRGLRTRGTAGTPGVVISTPTPSIRQIGRSTRPAPGTSVSTACISGSASSASNWLRYAAASYPSARTSQPCPCGNRTPTRRTAATRAAPVSGAPVTAGTRTTLRRRTAAANRRATFCNRPHNAAVVTPWPGIRKNRIATTAANPTIISPNRRTSSGTAARGVVGEMHCVMFL